MIQQHMARKAHDDVHYAEGVYKYVREYAVSISSLVSFICTHNMHEILLGELDFPVATCHNFPETLKYWVNVKWGQSYLVGRRCLFSLGLQPF